MLPRILRDDHVDSSRLGLVSGTLGASSRRRVSRDCARFSISMCARRACTVVPTTWVVRRHTSVGARTLRDPSFTSRRTLGLNAASSSARLLGVRKWGGGCACPRYTRPSNHCQTHRLLIHSILPSRIELASLDESRVDRRRSESVGVAACNRFCDPPSRHERAYGDLFPASSSRA